VAGFYHIFGAAAGRGIVTPTGLQLLEAFQPLDEVFLLAQAEALEDGRQQKGQGGHDKQHADAKVHGMYPLFEVTR